MRKIDDREKKFFLFIVATKGRSQKKKLMEFSIKLTGWVSTLNGKFHYYYCQAQFQSSPSLVQLELSTALILIISTPTHPRDSSNEKLLDHLQR